MPICSYLVFPADGAAAALTKRLNGLPGCEVTRAANRDVLLLVTDTAGAVEDEKLRGVLERLEGVRTLALTFGEVTPS